VKGQSCWKDHDHWSCLGHVPPITLPASSHRCWMAGCSKRPDEALRPEYVEPAPIAIVSISSGERCAYPECSNIARDGSKYCSRQCSNRNARKRHKDRHAA